MTWTFDSKSTRKSSSQALSPSSKIFKSEKSRSRSPFGFLSKRKHIGPSGSCKEVDTGEADEKEGEAQGKVIFWPKDLLKEDVPEARIMTFGYNTKITQGYSAANQGNIFSHAKDLLYRLEAKRRNAEKRDLVFIAHSLGGILVKEALRRSEADPDPKINNIFTSTTGVFFFGTPHRGSNDWASFGQGIATVAGRLLGVDTNDKVIHALLPTSPELELCRESFAVQWVKRGDTLTVRTFQESKGVTGIRWGGFNQLIVPPYSSTLDHPNERARTIDADHIEMVKFSGKNDENYAMVRDDIIELVKKAEQMAGKGTPEKKTQYTINLSTVEDASYDSKADQDIPQCLPGTRVSILTQITGWVNNLQSGDIIFWLYGPAGTGKSTIARTLAHSLANNGQLGASYFFRRGQEGRNGTNLFFPTIATQLVHTIPTFGTYLEKSLNRFANAKVEKKALGEQFKTLVQDPLSDLLPYKSGVLTKIIVIDALDECEEYNHVSQILSLFLQLRKLSTIRLRVFLTSRSANPIVNAFEGPENKVTLYRSVALHGGEFSAETKTDISTFLKEQFTTIKTKGKITKDPWPDPKDLDRLLNLATHPSPLFIYATTLCRFVYDDDDEGREEPGDQLDLWLEQCDSNAPQLYQIYMPILDQLLSGNYKKGERPKTLNSKNRSRLLQIISSIILLATPLPAQSLAILLNIDKDKVNHGLRNFHAVLNIPREPSKPVQLLHKSFSDFMLGNEGTGAVDFQINPIETHMMLASKCIQRMESQSNGLRKDICDVQEPGKFRNEIGKATITDHIAPDLEYACLYWIFHLQQSGQHIVDGDEVYNFLCVHFLHWLEALSLVGRISESIDLIGILQSLIAADRSTKLSRFLDDAEMFTMRNLGMFDATPLQLYCSAIIFAPESSIIKQLFRDKVPKWICKLPNMQSTWSPEIQRLQGHTDTVDAVTFSPDGRFLASGSGDDTVRIWNPATGQETQKFKGHTGAVNGVAFSPDGKLLASGSSDDTVRIWNLATGQEVQKLEGHTAWVNAVPFSPDGKLLASGSGDDTVRIWNPATGQEVRKLEGHTDSVYVVAFSPDGKLLASGSRDETVRTWNPATGQEVQKFLGHTDCVYAVAFSPDGKLLVSSSRDSTVRIWNPATGQEVQKLQGHTSWVDAIAFSLDGMLLAAGSDDRTVRIWNPATGQEVRKLEGHTDRVCAVAFSPDGKLLASGSGDDTVRIWNPAMEQESQKLEGHTDYVYAVAFSPDGMLLASGLHDMTVRIWNPATGQEVQKFEGHTSWVRAVAFSSDSKLLASGSGDYTAKIWNLATGQEVWEFLGHDDFVYAVSFSPDGKLLASGSGDNTVRIWNLATGQEVQKLEGHTNCVYVVAFSPDSKLLVSGSSDNTARIWNLATGQEVQKFEGHTNTVSTVAFSPDGKLLASSSFNEAKLWNPATGQEIQKLGFEDVITGILFSVKGQFLGTDGRLLMSEFCTPPAFSQQTDTTSHIFVEKDWISVGLVKLIWIPPEYRPSCSAFQNNILALACDSGPLVFIEFSESFGTTYPYISQL
ncbi:WD40-repeat-containing domain protein [Tricladium varicosporioides]|nr:WD40-repeat-containing domain protein [Hymenoscyphus varicosporioides]